MKTSRPRPVSLRLLAAMTLLITWTGTACSRATPKGSGRTDPLSLPLAPCNRTEPTDPTKKAVVIGINDYSASGLAVRAGTPPPDRKWRDLEGAINDAEAIYQLLTCRHGFAPANVRLLRDQEATRAAILTAIRELLVDPANKGDHLVLFYSGHGSQVVSSKSEEGDKKDESLVPADSRLGARDIRDKELRRLLGPALTKGARLTVILDSCHSGSGARGPVWLLPRRIEPDPREVADDAPAGPTLEARGALVLSASQDSQDAYEAWDENGRRHGAMTLALLRALRSAAAGESAAELFVRLRAFLWAEPQRQDPVLAGGEPARSMPLLGERTDQDAGRTVAAVESIEAAGRVVLNAGWIHGLAVGSRLAAADVPANRPALDLEVTALEGLTRSQAKVTTTAAGAAMTEIATGQLFVLSGWATPPGPPLPVWIPEAPDTARAWAAELLRQATAAGVVLTDDPMEPPGATHVVGWDERGWYLSGPDRGVALLGVSPVATAVIERLRGSKPPARLFVQVPVAPALARQLTIGAGTARSKVQPIDVPGRAVYVLAGRLRGGALEHAWMLSGMTEKSDALPPRSRWLAFDLGNTTAVAAAARGLSADAVGLARVYSWLRLDAPSPGADSAFPYHLALKPGGLKEEPTTGLRTEGELVEGERYGFVLRAPKAMHMRFVQPHWVYAFSIDRAGKCTLLFPPPGRGNVENLLPLEKEPPYPLEIPLSPHPLFEISEPFGTDTYYLLVTAEPIPDPWVLECRGVRRSPLTALEELLLELSSETRGNRSLYTTESWFLDRLFFRSVAAGSGM